MKCQIENQQHHADENRDRGIFSGQNFIRADRAQALLALMRLDDAGFDQRFNERIAHIRDGRVAVKSAFQLHLDDGVLDQLLFVLVKVQLLQHGFIAVDDPRRRDADGKTRPQRAPMQPAAPKTADQLFEEKLKAFMSESDNKLSSMRADHRTKSSSTKNGQYARSDEVDHLTENEDRHEKNRRHR